MLLINIDGNKVNSREVLFHEIINVISDKYILRKSAEKNLFKTTKIYKNLFIFFRV